MDVEFSGVEPVFCAFRPAAWLRITGADAATFLQGQFTNDLRLLDERRAVYGLWLDQKGKVLADSFVLRGAVKEEFWVTSYFSPAVVLRERLEAYVIADDVVIEDLTASQAAITLVGAGAQAWLAGNHGDGIFFPGRRARVENMEWMVPPDRIATARERLVAGGARELSETNLERLRVEAAIPAVPQDIGPGELPNEGGLEIDAVSYTKGCYLGQEVMARLKSMGRVRRRLLRVIGTGAVPAPLPAPLFSGGRKIGELRSAVVKTADEFCGLALLSLMNLKPRADLALAVDREATLQLADEPMSELQQLTDMFSRLGADRAQAETMAAQLLKRAGQLAVERRITREEALANLLRLVVQGRAGEAPGSSSPPPADGK